MLLRALSKYLLNTDGLGASTTSLGSLLQCLTTRLVKKCFLMSSLNLSWCSFESFPCVLSLDTREKWSAFWGRGSSHHWQNGLLAGIGCHLLSFSFCEHFFPFIPFLFAIVSLTILWAVHTTSSSLCCQTWQDQHRSRAEKTAAFSVMMVHGRASPGSCSSSTGWFPNCLDTWVKTFLLGYEAPWITKFWTELILQCNSTDQVLQPCKPEFGNHHSVI